MASQQFCLKWNNHTSNMLKMFENFLTTETFVDVTLACDGLSLKAHKMVLSACSSFFQSLFLENPCKHPVIIMKDVNYKDLKAILDFMYYGEMNVSQDQLPTIFKTAETLKVKGLVEASGENLQESAFAQHEVPSSQQNSVPIPASTSLSQQTSSIIQQQRVEFFPLQRIRKRGQPHKRLLSDSNRRDDEVVPTKIQEPDFPEIKELSGGITIKGENDTAFTQGSNLFQESILSSHPHTSQHAQVEEPPSGEGNEMEPSKLLEQILTTADKISSKNSSLIIKLAAPSISNATSSSSSISSANSYLPSSSGMEISQVGMSNNCTALVPVSGISDLLSSSHLQECSSDIEQLKINQKTMMDVLPEFLTLAKQIESKLNSLSVQFQDQSHHMTESDIQPTEDMTFISSLPVGFDDFIKLDEKIAKNPSFRQNLVKILMTVGGRDSRAFIANALRRLISDDVGERFSLTGKQSKTGPVKQSFEKTAAYKLVLEVCFQVFSNSKENVLREAVGDWLMQAKFRKSRRAQRSFSQKASSQDSVTNKEYSSNA